MPQGGGIEWLTPTYSNNNKTITCEWDYDADTIMLIGDFGGNNGPWLIDLSTTACWFGSPVTYWTYFSTDTGVTEHTSRKIVITKTYTFSSVSFCAFKGKPTGYFN